MSVTETIGNYEVNYSRCLGFGSYGVVYKGSNQENGKPIAVKKIKKAKHPQLVERALELLGRFRTPHENILTIYETKLYKGDLCIFMEFCSKDLGCYFSSNTDLDLEGRLNMMNQIAKGLEALHKMNVIHRDIKPANILVKTPEPGPRCKLADFDLSKYIDPDLGTSRMVTDLGSPKYKAPEFSRKNADGQVSYHRDVDIYALGLLFLGIVQQLENFEETIGPCLETYSDISEKHNPIGHTIHARMIAADNTKSLHVVKILKSDNEEFKPIKRLIKRMTAADPTDRPDADRVVKDLTSIIKKHNQSEDQDEDEDMDAD